MRAARSARWKLVRHFESQLLDEFYDLAADPGEQRNLTIRGVLDKLTSEQVREHAKMDKRLRAWMESIDDPLLEKP